MPRIMIKCPETGRPVPTGLGMDTASYREADLGEQRVVCPYCKQVHVWTKKDAYLEEEAPGGGPSGAISGD